eukprot:3748700-Rhodomonas_salina.3
MGHGDSDNVVLYRCFPPSLPLSLFFLSSSLLHLPVALPLSPNLLFLRVPSGSPPAVPRVLFPVAPVPVSAMRLVSSRAAASSTHAPTRRWWEESERARESEKARCKKEREGRDASRERDGRTDRGAHARVEGRPGGVSKAANSSKTRASLPSSRPIRSALSSLFFSAVCCCGLGLRCCVPSFSMCGATRGAVCVSNALRARHDRARATMPEGTGA